MIRFLHHSKIELCLAAVGTLSNIIGENRSVVIRDNFLLNGIVAQVLSRVSFFDNFTEANNINDYVYKDHLKELINAASEFFCNILKGKPYPDSQFIDISKSIMEYVLKHIKEDEQVCKEAYWCCLFFLKYNENPDNDKICDRAVYLIKQPDFARSLIKRFQESASAKDINARLILRIICYIIMNSDDDVVEILVNAHVIDLFMHCLAKNQQNNFIKVEAITCITNSFVKNSIYKKEILS